jgi:hypothetical protein
MIKNIIIYKNASLNINNNQANKVHVNIKFKKNKFNNKTNINRKDINNIKKGERIFKI